MAHLLSVFVSRSQAGSRGLVNRLRQKKTILHEEEIMVFVAIKLRILLVWRIMTGGVQPELRHWRR